MNEIRKENLILVCRLGISMHNSSVRPLAPKIVANVINLLWSCLSFTNGLLRNWFTDITKRIKWWSETSPWLYDNLNKEIYNCIYVYIYIYIYIYRERERERERKIQKCSWTHMKTKFDNNMLWYRAITCITYKHAAVLFIMNASFIFIWQPCLTGWPCSGCIHLCDWLAGHHATVSHVNVAPRSWMLLGTRDLFHKEFAGQ